jgi:hypothetical protein
MFRLVNFMPTQQERDCWPDPWTQPLGSGRRLTVSAQQDGQAEEGDGRDPGADGDHAEGCLLPVAAV